MGYRFRPNQTEDLDRLVQYLKDNATLRVQLTGYADRQAGSTRINERLSKRRAEAIKAYLVAHGIVADRVATDYKGDTVQSYETGKENRVTIIITNS